MLAGQHDWALQTYMRGSQFFWALTGTTHHTDLLFHKFTVGSCQASLLHDCHTLDAAHRALLNITISCCSLQIRLNDPSQYQSIVDAEWNIIYDKLDKCVQSGAKIVLSRLAIGDLATQYFADRDIFCAGRVSTSCLKLTFKQFKLIATQVHCD